MPAKHDPDSLSSALEALKAAGIDTVSLRRDAAGRVPPSVAAVLKAIDEGAAATAALGRELERGLSRLKRQI